MLMTYIEHLDDKFRFGKFSGCTFAEVVEFTPGYIVWVLENVSGTMCVFCDSVIEELRQIFPNFEISPSFEAMRNRRIAEFENFEDGDYEEQEIDDYGYYDDNDPPTYGQYAGSYAQDEMGYSDDDIDTIFDGDPDAYWNID